MIDVSEHLDEAVPLPILRAEVYFSLQAKFLCDDDNKPLKQKAKGPLLPLPSFAKFGQVLVSTVVRRQGRQALADHYHEVFRLAQQYRKRADSIGYYFWMRPELCSLRGSIGFAWHDTYPQTAHVLQALQASGDNRNLFVGLEQGWQLNIYATAHEVYFGVGKDTDDVPGIVYRTNRARLVSQAAAALAQTRELLAYLVQETGHNPWGYRP